MFGWASDIYENVFKIYARTYKDLYNIKSSNKHINYVFCLILNFPAFKSNLSCR